MVYGKMVLGNWEYLLKHDKLKYIALLNYTLTQL